jgi:single-stranded DNA-binding protein
MKVITIVGTVGKDSEIRQNARGEFITFSVAVNKGYSRDAGTDWFNCNYYNTKLADHIKKGRKIVVSGQLSIDDKEYGGKKTTYYNINANQVEFAGPPKNDVKHTEHDRKEESANVANNMDDEIPF